MTVLVDDAAWPWRGDRWAHLASDTSTDELHAFAHELGIRRLAFQDDHYDVPAAVRTIAIANGARAVTSRVLVRALRSAGLRVRRRDRWAEAALEDAPVQQAVAHLRDAWPAVATVAWTTVLSRPGTVGLSAVLRAGEPAATAPLPAALAGWATRVTRPEGVVLDVVLAVTTGDA